MGSYEMFMIDEVWLPDAKAKICQCTPVFQQSTYKFLTLQAELNKLKYYYTHFLKRDCSIH